MSSTASRACSNLSPSNPIGHTKVPRPSPLTQSPITSLRAPCRTAHAPDPRVDTVLALGPCLKLQPLHLGVVPQPPYRHLRFFYHGREGGDQGRAWKGRAHTYSGQMLWNENTYVVGWGMPACPWYGARSHSCGVHDRVILPLMLAHNSSRGALVSRRPPRPPKRKKASRHREITTTTATATAIATITAAAPRARSRTRTHANTKEKPHKKGLTPFY